MAELSRRDLLKMAALGLGAVVLDGIVEACKSPTTGIVPTAGLPAASNAAGASETQPSTPALPTAPMPAGTGETPASTPGVPTASTPAGTGGPPPSPSSGYPDLVVSRKGTPEALVRGAIAALGGMERFVSPGAHVVVKPNICVSYRTYEYAATTNPWVVGTLVKMAFEAGASSVRVMDYPFGDPVIETW